KPGFSPDYVQPRQGWVTADGERSDWAPAEAAQALLRNNRPLLAYIAGKPDHFTSKDHNFFPGETVEKQIIIITHSREIVACEAEWSLGLPLPVTGLKKVTVRPGDQDRIPLRFDLPATLSSGHCEVTATIRFSTGETQNDSFSINVLARPVETVPN